MKFFTKKRSTTQLVIIGLIAYIIFSLLSAPATLVTGNLPKNLPIKLSNVDGTIWNGKASNLAVKGIDLGKFEWSLQLLQIFTGKIAANINLNSADVMIDGSAGYNFSGLLIEDTNIKTTLGWLSQTAAFPIPATATLNADIKHLNVDVSKISKKSLTIPRLDINLDLNNLNISFPEATKLGNYSLAINSEPKNKIRANLVRTKFLKSEGMLNIEGDVKLKKSGDYSTELEIKPSEKLPEIIQQGLTMIGKSKEDGSFTIDYEGHVREIMKYL